MKLLIVFVRMDFISLEETVQHVDQNVLHVKILINVYPVNQDFEELCNYLIAGVRMDFLMLIKLIANNVNIHAKLVQYRLKIAKNVDMGVIGILNLCVIVPMAIMIKNKLVKFVILDVINVSLQLKIVLYVNQVWEEL